MRPIPGTGVEEVLVRGLGGLRRRAGITHTFCHAEITIRLPSARIGVLSDQLDLDRRLMLAAHRAERPRIAVARDELVPGWLAAECGSAI